MTTDKVWKNVLLSKICENIQYGYTARATKNAVGPKFLRITDIVSETINWSEVPFCKIDDTKKKKYLLKEGDIVIARTGATTGYAKYIKEPPEAVFASYLVRLQLIDEAVSRYVGYIVESQEYKKFIKNNWSGAAQPNANAKILTSFILPYPSIPVQQKISSILSAFDDLIENNRKRIKILEEMAQNLYREWFIKFRFPGHENVRFVDSSLGKIPEGWKVKKLGDVVNLRKGKNISKKAARDGVVPVVGAGLNPAYYHDVSNAKQPVITISASGANAGYVNLYLENIWASDCSVIDSQSTSHVIFLYLYLKYKQMEITRMQRGSAQPHVYTKDLEKLNLVMPTRTIINKFEEIINPLFELNKNYLLRNNTLKKIRDIVLPKLVSGELDVSELDIEVPEKD